ncbi:MAG: hypothetical protein ACP5QG_01575 [candidate division WOR-3 bacterium]
MTINKNMRRDLLIAPLLLGVACGPKYYKVKADVQPLMNPRVQNILREEGGWAEIRVKVGKKTIDAPVMDVTPDSIKVFTGNNKRNDSLWVYPKEVSDVTYVMPMNAREQSLNYAKNAFLIGVISTATATAATWIFEENFKDKEGESSEPKWYLYVAAGLGALTLVATLAAYIVGYRIGSRKDKDLKNKLRVFLGLESWK